MAAAAAAPAWLAELSEAWIEPPAVEEEQGEDGAAEDSSTSSSSTGSVVVQQEQQQQSMMDFGSIVVKDSLILKTATTAAGSSKTGQLAYAVAALNGAGNMLLATPKTPNKLAMLFMRGGVDGSGSSSSEKPESKMQETSPTPAKTVQQQDNVQEIAVGPVQVQPEESSIVIQDAGSKPPSAEFSFHVEKGRPVSWQAHLPPPTPDANASSCYANDARPALSTSTPSATRQGSSDNANEAQLSASLGIFKFHHDTNTRRHLRALVQEVDNMASPPRDPQEEENGDPSRAILAVDSVLDETVEGLRRSMGAGILRPRFSGVQVHAQHSAEAAEDEDGRIGNTRSCKRVRLSMSEAPSRQNRRVSSLSSFSRVGNNSMQNPPMSPARQIIATLSSQTPFSSAARTNLARQYPHTARRLAMSTGNNNRASPNRRPMLRALPPMSVPARRMTSLIQTPEKTTFAGPVTPVNNEQKENTPVQSVVQNKLEEARALMARIRLRTSERELGSTSSSDKNSAGSAAAIAGRQNLGMGSAPNGNGSAGSARPANPTPMLASHGHSYPLPTISEAPTPAEEREDEMEEAGQAPMVNSHDANGNGQEEAPTAGGVEPPAAAAAAASIRLALTSSCLPRRASVTASIGTAGTAGSSSNKQRTFATAPIARSQMPTRRPVSFSSQASSDRFFTSTSTRLPSGSTAATSLITSQAGSWKAHGTAQGIVHISPEEAEQLLTREVLGDMVYDAHAQKWVKQQQQQQQREGGLSPIEEASLIESGGVLQSNRSEEDDPFRDITGFESSSGNNNSSSAHRRNKSGSLILPLPPAVPRIAGDLDPDRRSEKTSTPPLADAPAPPLVSPDVASIPTVDPLDSMKQQQQVNNLPRSALKQAGLAREFAFSTPMPSSRSTSGGQTRSVSFSDGKIIGKIATADLRSAVPTSSALRNEMYDTATEADEEEEDGAQEGLEDNEEEAEEVQEEDGDTQTSSIMSADLHDQAEGGDFVDPLTSTVVRTSVSQWPLPSHTQRTQPGGASPAHIESSSAQSTPTAVFPIAGRQPRSFRLKSQNHLSRSGISTTSTTAWHKRPLAANATILTECSFGVSYDRLVQVLTEVVPFEPSWKQLRRIDLSKRNIETVVRLKEFLPNLDNLDLSDNRLAYLTGLSASLRFLDLARNSLTDISSFSHLPNIESLDISGNKVITSITQLAGMKHLRKLKADGCAIQSLKGIEGLDGLVELSLIGNRIEKVHLESTSWHRLETLDLENNDISEVTGLETLAALKAVNLDRNRLVDLNLTAPSTEVRILKVSNNSLSNLDLALMPNLRTVFADSNSITEVTGVKQLRNLENLSLREQKHSTISLPVRHLRDLRRLFLSHNAIPATFPTEAFLNLTLLELTSCRLSSLPSDFSQLVPNVRVLNLDCNFLQSLAPISGLTRLHRLSVVGCRLEKVKDVLRSVGTLPELEVLDLRLNPITLSFYPPPAPLSSAARQVSHPSVDRQAGHTESQLEFDPAYKAADAQYRRSLPDEWLAKRSAYRSLVLTACSGLKILDGLRVGRGQRERAQELVDRFATI